MKHPSTTRRAVALTALVLHVLVLAVVPHVHAVEVVPDAGPRLTADGDGRSVPGHDELTCQLCRAFHQGEGLPTTGPVHVVAGPVVVDQSGHGDLVAPRIAAAGGICARAPPLS